MRSTFEAFPPEDARKELLERSPYASDGGELIGKIPAHVPSEILSEWPCLLHPLKRTCSE